MDEATIQDGLPVTAGWFVINAGQARWLHNDMRAVCRFGGEGPAHFDHLGIGLYWIEPGKPMSLYHHEAGQEDFLTLAGTAVLIIEGTERPLRPWDFVHCPPRTAHTIVATGDRPTLILAVGARRERGSARYPVQARAAALGAGVPDATIGADEVYARSGAPTAGPAPDLPAA